MFLEQLQVIHEPLTAAELELQVEGEAFVFDTCQRRIAIFNGSRPKSVSIQGTKVQLFRGVEAYEFLLRFICGLESSLPGETEVFGQFKEAWRTYGRANRAPLVLELQSWIQQLFKDAKKIRAEHLLDLGSASYAGLARKELEPNDGDSVLVMGAGTLAQSVLTLFKKQKYPYGTVAR